MGLSELTNPLPLPEDDYGHDESHDRPDDHKDPNVNFLISHAEDICPVHQYPYAPIENLIHHRCLQFFEMDAFYDVQTFKGLHGLSNFDLPFHGRQDLCHPCMTHLRQV